MGDEKLHGRDPYFWSNIADATDLTKLLLSVSEGEGVHDAEKMQALVGKAVWSRVQSLDVVEVYKNRGTAWTAWGFSTGGEWIVQSIRWTERALAHIRELLTLTEGEDTRDWVKIRTNLREGSEDLLRGQGKGRSQALVHVNPVREFDGKGKGWNGWEWTDKGRELAEMVG